MKDSITFAAVQLTARLGNVEENCETVRRLAVQAFRAGARWVVLPELFTSAVAFHPVMNSASRTLESTPVKMLKELAAAHNGVIGGSLLLQREAGVYNTFILALPDGKLYFHDKDQPTMWENCYYEGGDDDGIVKTPFGRAGIALCWEFIRTRTVTRLLGNIDFVVGGSCWWSLPERVLPGFPRNLNIRNRELVALTPSRFASMLGVPVIHAAHAGEFEGKMPLLPGFHYRSHYLGETQIVDRCGNVIVRMRREDGQGFIMADVDVSFTRDEPPERPAERFWIPELPWQFRFAWWYQNLHGIHYYQRKKSRVTAGRVHSLSSSADDSLK